jgi:hypothetical protein
MRLLQLMFTLVCLTATPAATQTLPPLVTGEVTDSAGRPMAHALVSVPGTEHAVRSDPAGRFAFHHLPRGFITLQAEFSGYLVAQRDSVLVESGRPIVVNFRLLDRPVRDNPNVLRQLPPVDKDSE